MGGVVCLKKCAILSAIIGPHYNGLEIHSAEETQSKQLSFITIIQRIGLMMCILEVSNQHFTNPYVLEINLYFVFVCTVQLSISQVLKFSTRIYQVSGICKDTSFFCLIDELIVNYQPTFKVKQLSLSRLQAILYINDSFVLE